MSLTSYLSFLLPVSGLALLSSCSSPTAANDPYGLWLGKLVTDQGQCPTENLSLLRIRGNTIIFNPDTGSKILHGTLKNGDFHYHAELVEKGMNSTPYQMTFDGYPVGKGIGGLYASPRCHAHITLTRQKSLIF